MSAPVKSLDGLAQVEISIPKLLRTPERESMISNIFGKGTEGEGTRGRLPDIRRQTGREVVYWRWKVKVLCGGGRDDHTFKVWDPDHGWRPTRSYPNHIRDLGDTLDPGADRYPPGTEWLVGT